MKLGLARTGMHGDYGSGDLTIAFSTAQLVPCDPTSLVHAVSVLNEQHPVIDAHFTAVVEKTKEAVINALFAANSIDGRDGYHL